MFGSIHEEFWVPGMQDWDPNMSRRNKKYRNDVAEGAVNHPLVLRKEYL